MIFRQLTHDDLGCASYLVGDDRAGIAAVVDPRLEIGEYLRLARYLGVEIAHVIETHPHADHVSGHGHLAAATGATIHIHREAGAGYDHEPFDDGWTLALGALRVEALHPPGHRPEHTAFLLTDTARGDEPWAVLTGDSLFVGDIARPDLAVDKEEGARGVFNSLHDKLLNLPPETEVWPLAPRQVEAKRAEGALVVDVRTDLQFDEAHIPGAVAITALPAGFGTKLAWIADRDEEIVLVGRDDEEGRRAAKLATAVGIRNLGGVLSGGMTSWRAEGREVAAIERVDIHALHQRTIGENGIQILDVREDDEWERAHIPGSIHVPYHDIHSLPEAIDPERPVAAICASGQRSAVAASLVARFGAQRVIHVTDGGVGTWQRAGHPIE